MKDILHQQLLTNTNLYKHMNNMYQNNFGKMNLKPKEMKIYLEKVKINK